MMHTYAIKHDLDRFAAGVPRASPRQADVIIVPGTIVSKFAPRMKRVYDQMPEPKFVVGMGSCTISGGPFQEGYNVIKGAEEVIPVDIHIPGCPPRPEALIYGIAKLQERIANGESSPVTVKPYELEQFGDLERDEIVDKLAAEIDEEDLVMRYNWGLRFAMSLEEQQSDDPAELESGVSRGDELADLLGDLVVGREEHMNAPGLVIRPDEVQDALFKLRDEAGFDHLSCVTAQEYEDRYESIYHLTKFDDRTDEVSVVVPTSKDNPVSQSAEPVFRTADWHEREAYDLVGIQYEDHPDLRRILLPDTWQGHPLGLDYDQDRPQIATLREHANPLEEDHRAGDSNTMYINIGPHHPATHGVLHVETVVDGEQVVDLESDIGYLHRCEEQMCQQGTYRHQIMPYPDRWDYISAGLLNEWGLRPHRGGPRGHRGSRVRPDHPDDGRGTVPHRVAHDRARDVRAGRVRRLHGHLHVRHAGP